MGIIMGRPQWLHGTVASGGRSPGMKTLVSHHPQVTKRKGLSLMLVTSPIYHYWPRRQAPSQTGPVRFAEASLLCIASGGLRQRRKTFPGATFSALVGFASHIRRAGNHAQIPNG
jgi:hypothetical protein